jgi:hypothetical protein
MFTAAILKQFAVRFFVKVAGDVEKTEFFGLRNVLLVLVTKKSCESVLKVKSRNIQIF